MEAGGGHDRRGAGPPGADPERHRLPRRRREHPRQVGHRRAQPPAACPVPEARRRWLVRAWDLPKLERASVSLNDYPADRDYVRLLIELSSVRELKLVNFGGATHHVFAVLFSKCSVLFI
jgi:hypothetical protein